VRYAVTTVPSLVLVQDANALRLFQIQHEGEVGRIEQRICARVFFKALQQIAMRIGM